MSKEKEKSFGIVIQSGPRCTIRLERTGTGEGGGEEVLSTGRQGGKSVAVSLVASRGMSRLADRGWLACGKSGSSVIAVVRTQGSLALGDPSHRVPRGRLRASRTAAAREQRLEHSSAISLSRQTRRPRPSVSGRHCTPHALRLSRGFKSCPSSSSSRSHPRLST